MAKPLINQMPAGALQQMMLDRLSSLTGLSGEQLGKPHAVKQAPRQRLKSKPLEAGQLSPMALAISLLLQNPELGNKIESSELVQKLEIEGAQHLRQMLALISQDAGINTARLLEHFRDSGVHNYLEKLASYPTSIHSEALPRQFNDTLAKLLAQQDEHRRLHLLEKSRGQGLEGEEKQELLTLLEAKKQRIDQVNQ